MSSNCKRNSKKLQKYSKIYSQLRDSRYNTYVNLKKKLKTIFLFNYIKTLGTKNELTNIIKSTSNFVLKKAKKNITFQNPKTVCK